MDYLSFEGRIIPMEWGKAVYTVLPIPAEIDAALRSKGAKRVEGEINDLPINLALTRAPVMEGSFLWTGKTFMAAANLSPGEPCEVRLRPAANHVVEIPSDVVHAIRASGRLHIWEALSPGKKRGLLHQIETAKRAETRAKRIAKVVAELL